MGKKTAKKETPEQEVPTSIDPFVGGEDDDLMDMEYVQDESTVTVDTHPPETKEEAEARDESKATEEKKTKDEELEAEVEQELTDEKDEQQETEAEAEAEEVLEDPKIPKDRFDEINERMKKAEKEAADLKAQLETVIEDKTLEPEPEPYDYKAKDKEAMDALLEGDADKYSAINDEIRQAEKAEYVREAKKLADTGDQNLRENMTFEEAGAKIEADFPQLSATDENFNEEAREEMLDLFVGYAQSGRYTRVQALQRAADKISKLYKFNEVAEDPASADNIVDIRKPNPKKKAEIANAQPPAMETTSEEGREEAKLDIASMSDEEFDNLPESTKRRARGDIL